MYSGVEMKRKIILTALVYVLFFTSFNSVVAPTYARFNRALNGSSKSFVASSNTIWVPDNYTTIQEAINNASEGDTIFVRAGTYPEHVVVDKALSLVGENKRTIINGWGTGTVVHVTANNITLNGFTIQNGQYGIWIEGSTNSILTGNTVSSINLYGIWLYDSDSSVLTGNDASNNGYGVYLYHSTNNVFSGNDASNNYYGILVSDSDNSVLTGNNASNNKYGVYLYYSSNNVFSGNDASNNGYGVYLDHSINNVFSGNDASNNHYGIHVSYSDNNVIFHNNFINNTEPPSSISSVGFFDNGVEGNYWSDYNGTDADWDGIGDTPHPLHENNQDNCPLMGPFSEFNVKIGEQSYTVDIVCNSTISNFQGYYDAGNQTNVVSFMVNGTKGKGFCRICIPHVLIEPQYIVTIDHNPPLYSNAVRTNGTHTWLYFAYHHSEHEVMIIHMPTPPEQLAFWSEWWFWTIIALALIVVVLLSLSIKQKKVIQAYKREVRNLYGARALFKADVEKRRAKIEDFKRKYNMEIRTADTLEDLFKRWEFKKEA